MPSAEIREEGSSNYFAGKDPDNWVTNVPHYGRVRYEDVYPGIDLVYYGNRHRLEYDFVVAPGADPRAIHLAFRGADRARLDRAGDLVLNVGGRDFVQRRPVVYQESGGRKVPVDGDYVLDDVKGNDASINVRFALGEYDRRTALVIDPVLVYSTYFEDVQSLAVDADGNVYVTGSTQSTDFPVVGGLSPEQGGHPPTGQPPFDNVSAFVAKLTPQGDHLVYATYLSSNTSDGNAAVNAYSLKIDDERAAYVAGLTISADFPVVGGLPTGQAGIPDGSPAVWVAKLNPDGNALEYSTYLGAGNGREMIYPQALDIDAAGNAYVTGFTTPPYGFPVVGGLSSEQGGEPHGDGSIFVAKLDAAGDALVYSTYLSGSTPGFAQAEAIDVDADGQAYIGGGANTSQTLPRVGGLSADQGGDPDFDSGFAQPAYLAKLNAAGDALIYATYLSGGAFDDASAIAVDASGNLYVTGKTDSDDFPIVGGLPPEQGGQPDDSCCVDIFVSKINAEGDALVYSTYLGGNSIDGAYGLSIDDAGSAYITGQTKSSDFPQINPLSPEQGGAQDSGPFGQE
jgi:hypothetical protein